MKSLRIVGFAAALALAALTPSEREAHACAVFTPDQTAAVAGHTMVLSVTKDETTLWDQFYYTGSPASFGWILPTKGLVKVGVSSDALFEALGTLTAPQIFAPATGCPNTCKGTDGQGGGFGNGGVTVIAEEVVGPFETVQLAAQDPNALKDWLAQNGYPIPSGVGPVLDAYVAEGFGFLALKLAPDKGLDAVRPVRVTFPGAMPTIPLRLLAAGTGELTPVTLWVVGEGRWEPANAPVVTLADSDLTWDFAAKTSDYSAARAKKLAATDGKGWLIEQARPIGVYEVQDPLEILVQSDPAASGYGDDMMTPEMALADDLDALLGKVTGEAWVTRLTADLSRKAFAEDLSLKASSDQSVLDGSYVPKNLINKPACPPDPCGAPTGAGGGDPTGGSGLTGGGQDADGEASSCELREGAGSDGATPIVVIGAALLLAAARRRRAR
jgi:hypothetical protein